ncbi:MAG: class I SAM-dependent methyltransferase [Planctomycetota bacterium]
MLQEPYASTPIRRLLETHRLEIEDVGIDTYYDFSPAHLFEHFRIETQLAEKLKTSSPEERRSLYAKLYDEIFSSLPDHPQLARRADPAAAEEALRRELAVLAHYLWPDSVYLEVGAGSCRLCLEIAKRVRLAYAVDVSSEIFRGIRAPQNLRLLISDGVAIDVPSQTVDFAYSNQLLEHLHPDDAILQVREIHRILGRGGAYLCLTPHRFAGPADISRFFSDEPQGLHLREYTNGELRRLFLSAGFSRVRLVRRVRGRIVELPLGLTAFVERALACLPRRTQRRLSRKLRWLLRIRLIAYK